MMNITVIKGIKKEKDIKRLNVAAYCRVSTEKDEQYLSLELQKEYYENYIKENKEWNFAGVFSDRESGLTDKRQGFQKLLDDCKKKKVDLIITKSLSRFSRNVHDTVLILEELSKMDIAVYFEIENINSLDDHTQFATVLFAIRAQEESIQKGRNIQFGIQHKFREGTSGFSNIECFGYKKDESGKLVKDSKQSEIVKNIFDWYLNGQSMYGIAKTLTDQKILTSRGSLTWRASQIDTILKNRKYTGDVLLQKTIVVDTKKQLRKTNSGEYNQYLLHNHHKEIIPLELFEKVQNEIERRFMNDSLNKSHYSSKPMSGMIYCKVCGNLYKRITRTDKNGEKVAYWRCGSNLDKKCEKCKTSPTVSEEVLKTTICEKLEIEQYDDIKARQEISKIEINTEGNVNSIDIRLYHNDLK